MNSISRRDFLRQSASALATAAFAPNAFTQIAGERPQRAPGVTVLNPRARVPASLIIDDSTCLVNLNRFAMPQFDFAHKGLNPVYRRNWREWPVEIPDSFVRKFGEWAAKEGVKGKYSVVPFPACVGRLDRMLPGWTQRELGDSIELVRTLLMPNWDIHPEMNTHTRVIDTKTGHPYPEFSTKFMENWEWTTGRSVDEIADYLAYALRILKNVGLTCEGITTPGGFGNQARPQLAQATLQAVRDVFGAEIPHYFRDLYSEGDKSVAPLVQYAARLNDSDPRCVVSIIGCSGDWTGGWDCVPVTGADKFITADLKSGRLVDIIARGEPALFFGHWTGIYWNGQELGFKVLQEVVRRLQARYDNLIWMKLSEVARYWAARELTNIERTGNRITLKAPFASPNFTLGISNAPTAAPKLTVAGQPTSVKEVSAPLKLTSGAWVRRNEEMMVCFDLPRGVSILEL